MNRSEKLEKSPEQLEFYHKLLKLKEEFDRLFKENFNRSIPFADLVFDRWEKAKSLGFGEGSSIYDSSYVAIGSNCSISAGVQIYSHDTVEWAISGGVAPYEYGPVVIGNNCYIGPNAIISLGVTLGEGCIVGANSFVNKSYPSGSKIAGSPARLI
jgi:acetyltransferase-like isoleucine patch superfamily enzyme